MHRLWIKSWRRKLDSNIWKMPPMYMRVFEWILHSVNHDPVVVPTTSGPVTVNPGQRITSLRQIADGVSYYEHGVQRVPNVKTIKVILEWLEGNGKCTVESNGKGTIITVMNWHTYNRKDDEKVTAREQEKVTPSKQTSDTNKNEKNEKNKKAVDLFVTGQDGKVYSHGELFEALWKAYPSKDGKKEALRHYNASVKTESDMKAINLALSVYLDHLSTSTWKNPKNGSTWFNNWQDWTPQQEP